MNKPYPVSKVPAPEHHNGTKYRFFCCPMPDVWKYSDDSERCENCGYWWANK